MTSPLWLPNIPPSMPNVTAGNPATVMLGSWNTLTDQFTFHPASPTGAIINLNDGVNWSLADTGSGFGEGLDWDMPKPDVYTSTNPRTVGERVTRINYGKARRIKLHLVLGQTANYTTFIGNLRTLIQTLQGISPDQPAALKLQITQASTPVYADVLQGQLVTHYKEILYNQLIDDGVEVELLCRPFLRGARQTLQNLVVNPGFEAPSGPGVQVFSDTFTSTNAYALQAGGAPTLNAATTWVDVVESGTANAPARFLRLGESSGATAYDIAGTGAAGTSANCTLGSTALVSGDTGTSYLFNGTSSKVTIPTTGLPTGNSPMTIGEGFRISALPAASAILFSFGGTALTAHQNIVVYIIPAGKLQCDVSGSTGTITGVTTITTNANHLAEVKWDGTTLTLYLDGVSQGTSTPGAQAIPAGPTLTLGVNTNNTSWFAGNLQEFYFYAAADTGQSARWTAFSTGATGTQANTMSIPAAGRVAFGSPAWGAINQWQVRFRWVSGLTLAQFFLHYTDTNNFLVLNVTATAAVFHQVIGGVDYNIGSSGAIVLTHEAWYWIKITQFPTVSGTPPLVQATLFYSNAGAVGSQVTNGTVGPVATQDAVTALSGRPQISASGAALVVGGNYANVHTVSLFGPGGWQSSTFSGIAAYAWEQSTANTYPNGPVTSYGAARIDAPPAGAWNAIWKNYNGGAPAGTNAIPVAAAGDVLGVSAWTKSSGLGANAQIALYIAEYDISGTFLRQTAIQSKTGNQASWTQLAGTLTTGASCAYAAVYLNPLDSTAGASANAIVWFDNVQLWDQTTTGQTSMPYCELRFPQSPAQLMVSGLLGDVSVPVFLSLGTFVNTAATAQDTLSFLIGRRENVSAGGVLVGKTYLGFNGNPVLDSGSYGGYYWVTGSASSSVSVSLDNVNSPLANSLGTYYMLTRFLSKQSAGNLSKVGVQGSVIEVSPNTSGAGVTTGAVVLGVISGSNTWTVATPGQMAIPPYPNNALQDLTALDLSASYTWVDQSGSPALSQTDWWAWLPMSASFLNATFGPANLSGYSPTWFWFYFDGLQAVSGKRPIVSSVAFNFGANYVSSGQVGTMQPLPSQALGSSIVASLAEPYLTLDPTQMINGVSVNQLVASMADSGPIGTVLPIHIEVQYSPLYLLPQ